MSTIALKEKNYAGSSRKHGMLKELAKIYREHQAEIVSGLMSLNGNPSAIKMYQMLKK